MPDLRRSGNLILAAAYKFLLDSFKCRRRLGSAILFGGHQRLQVLRGPTLLRRPRLFIAATARFGSYRPYYCGFAEREADRVASHCLPEQAGGGDRVALWNRSAERVEPVRQRGGVHLTSPDGTAVVAPIAVATSQMALALAGAEVVLVAVPASGHAEVARAAAAHLRDGQTVLLLPGRTGGALEFRRILSEAGCRADVLLGEANTFPRLTGQ